ncbi:MAG: hypothetical protein OXH11_08945 [Candidatus Aminicenantes bacterium]|nr:hypothetical protein [Candidatus Aminicenantes bacterium]
MARVQLLIPDDDHARFVQQARIEGMSLSAWLIAAARRRVAQKRGSLPFESAEALQRFFRECDALKGPKVEPDWEEHSEVINDSRRGGTGGP